MQNVITPPALETILLIVNTFMIIYVLIRLVVFAKDSDKAIRQNSGINDHSKPSGQDPSAKDSNLNDQLNELKSLLLSVKGELETFKKEAKYEASKAVKYSSSGSIEAGSTVTLEPSLRPEIPTKTRPQSTQKRTSYENRVQGPPSAVANQKRATSEVQSIRYAGNPENDRFDVMSLVEESQVDMANIFRIEILAGGKKASLSLRKSEESYRFALSNPANAFDDRVCETLTFPNQHSIPHVTTVGILELDKDGRYWVVTKKVEITFLDQ